MQRTANIISWLMLGLVLLALALLALPRFLGCELFYISSGSMEPAYPVGSVVYVRPTDAAHLEPGDPITALVGAPEQIAVTHRIIEIDQQNRQFYTKGDANETADDRPIPYDHVIGKVILCIPSAGYLLPALTSPILLVVILVVALALPKVAALFAAKPEQSTAAMGGQV